MDALRSQGLVTWADEVRLTGTWVSIRPIEVRLVRLSDLRAPSPICRRFGTGIPPRVGVRRYIGRAST
jgi:hypothetical protein